MLYQVGSRGPGVAYWIQSREPSMLSLLSGKFQDKFISSALAVTTSIQPSQCKSKWPKTLLLHFIFIYFFVLYPCKIKHT